MEIATFRLHTASLHQAIRSTGCTLAYKAHGCAVIGWFSTAVIGASRSSVFCMLVYCCSLGGPQSYSSPVVVFFDGGHLCFRNFNSTVPVDIFRLKSYVNRLFDPACVPVRVTINKLYLIPKRVVSGVVGVLCNGGNLGAGESDVPVVFFDPSSLADVNFATFTGNPVTNAILLSRHERCSSKLARFTNHLTFLTRCIKNRIVPKDLQVRPPVPTKGARRVAELASMRFLRERIRLTQKAKADAKKEADSTSQSVTSAPSTEDADRIQPVDLIAWWRLAVCSRNVAISITRDYVVRQTK